MNGAHPYLKVSIRHCIVTERWPLEADLRREHESRIYWKLPTKRFSLTLDYESRLINCDRIVIMDIVSSWLLYITYINSTLTENQLPSVEKQATEDKFSKENGEGTKDQRKSLLPRPPFFLLWLCAAPAETVFSREIGRSKNKLTNKRKRVDSRIDTHTHIIFFCVWII